MFHWFTLALLAALPWLPQAGARDDAPPPDVRLYGVVKDSTGAVIVRAEIVFSTPTFHSTQLTDRSGQFVFEHVPVTEGTIVVHAAGFDPTEQKWSAAQAGALQLVLIPASVAQLVTVTASRTQTRLLDTPTSVVVLTPEDLSSTAALTVDDALRQVPGFTLFRRSGSRTANPTSQGVSLRGLGASGASRAIVFSDGIPLNDPFGGWVYWDRIPRPAIRSVEVAKGGASPLYGTGALGGAVNILRKPVDEPGLSLETSYGSEFTPDLSMLASERVRNWGGRLSLGLFHTDGYMPVALSQRGQVDTFAASEHVTGDLTLERLFSDRGRIFLRGSSFGETRKNGTPLQNNRTTIREIDLGGDWRSTRVGAFSLVAYVGRQVFNQTFSAIALDRNSESLTQVQRVPARQVGINGQWSRPLGSRQTLVAGGEAYEVRGESDDLSFAGGAPSAALRAGGRQRNLALFWEDLVRLTSRWSLTLGGRVDHWRNFDGFSFRQPLAPPGPLAVTPLTARAETFFSPRAAMLYKLTGSLSLTGSAYRSFRAPTLNELYRSFRVGNILTLAKDQLEAERLTGGEAGAIFTAFDQRLMLRGDFFWSEITRPVANVTLSVTPTLITRQRQNLGRTRSRGLELEATARLRKSLFLSGGYQFDDATVVRFSANPAREGLQVPQVSRHQFTIQGRYSRPSLLTLAIQARFVGTQFEDDLNTLPLDRYFTLDAFLSHPVHQRMEVFAAVENLLNQRYDIGRTPVRTIAPPLSARVGMRLQLGAR